MTLEPATPNIVTIPAAQVRLAQFSEPLPPYPQNLPAPKVTFDFVDDNPGKDIVSFYVGSPNSILVSVWTDDEGDLRNSIDDGHESTGWDDDTNDEFLTWAVAVRERIVEQSLDVSQTPFDNTVNEAIVANALGQKTSLPADGTSLRAATLRYDLHEAVSDRAYRTKQGYSVERTLTIPADGGAPAQKLRGTFHIDYDENLSRSTVELWTPQGWTEVDRLHGRSFVEAIPSFNEDDEVLESRARRILDGQTIDAIRVIS